MTMRRAMLLFACLLQAASPTRASQPWTIGDKGFITGLNGHAVSQVPDTDVQPNELIALLQKSHVAFYRFDVPSNPNWEALDTLVDALNKAGIAPLPVIFPPGNRSKTLTPEQVDGEAFAYATALIQRYKGRIHYWELSNELDSFCILMKGDMMPNGKIYPYGAPSGWDPAQIVEKRYQVALATLRGLSRGIRSVDPTARLIVNSGGWLHVGFLDRLQRDKLDYDIVGWHWYSDYGDIRKVEGKPLLDHLASYRKPIWITEGNYRPRKDERDDDKPQADYLQAALTDFSGLYPIVQAYCVYTLLNKPGEGAYGVVNMEKTADSWQVGKPKPAFDVIANFSPD
jgi:hypothetical protein